MSDVYLTKSRFMAGQQCALRLWKQCFEPMPYQPPEPGSFAAIGLQIGEAAQRLFLGGILVDVAAGDHASAVRRTRELMSGGSPAIFEAAFEHGPLRVRVDVLENKGPSGWAIHEVKSSTSIKDEHLADVAFQAEVLRQAGVPLDSIQIIHINSNYQRGVDGVDWHDFFKRQEVTEEVAAHSAEVLGLITPMMSMLQPGSPPNVDPGRHCKQPRECEFLSQCTAHLPSDWIGKLPRITKPQFEQLQSAGITSIAEIPNSVRLSVLQRTVQQVHKTGRSHINRQARAKLKVLGPPAAYLDFECVAPAIPIYAGTKPYQAIPFLWSLHREDDSSNLNHTDFIADPGVDPRRPFAESLLSALDSSSEPIVVYSSYEARILKELADALPDLAADIEDIRDRLQDLLVFVRGNVYMPQFNGSFSIKDVGPALDPSLTYDGLAIANGTAASMAYQQLVEGNTAGKDPATVLQNLRDYCERDTEAMVKVHQALQKHLK